MNALTRAEAHLNSALEMLSGEDPLDGIDTLETKQHVELALEDLSEATRPRKLLPVGEAFVDPTKVIAIYRPWNAGDTGCSCAIEFDFGCSFSLRGVTPEEAAKALGLT